VAESGADTVTDVLAELLALFVSTAEELLMFEVLLIVSPFRSVLTVEATIVAVPDWPLANEANVIVRLSPAPLSQTPPGPGVQETNVTKFRGKRSLMATEAGLGPLFVMVMLYVS
jgi:hypothetical protein